MRDVPRKLGEASPNSVSALGAKRLHGLIGWRDYLVWREVSRGIGTAPSPEYRNRLLRRNDAYLIRNQRLTYRLKRALIRIRSKQHSRGAA